MIVTKHPIVPLGGNGVSSSQPQVLQPHNQSGSYQAVEIDPSSDIDSCVVVPQNGTPLVVSVGAPAIACMNGPFEVRPYGFSTPWLTSPILPLLWGRNLTTQAGGRAPQLVLRWHDRILPGMFCQRRAPGRFTGYLAGTEVDGGGLPLLDDSNRAVPLVVVPTFGRAVTTLRAFVSFAVNCNVADMRFSVWAFDAYKPAAPATTGTGAGSPFDASQGTYDTDSGRSLKRLSLDSSGSVELAIAADDNVRLRDMPQDADADDQEVNSISITVDEPADYLIFAARLTATAGLPGYLIYATGTTRDA